MTETLAECGADMDLRKPLTDITTFSHLQHLAPASLDRTWESLASTSETAPPGHGSLGH